MAKNLLIGVVVLVVGYAMLPTLGSMLGGALDEVIAVLLALAPKVAIAAGITALILLCIPFTRHHAQGMLVGAIVLAFGAATFSTGIGWVESHSGLLAADLASASDTLLAHVTGQAG
jgi:hypothetical protein